MSDPAATVVIPALNAAATIGAQLEALAAQSFNEPWELIVVDNGSADHTADIARAAAHHPLCEVRLVDEPQRGLNAARNAGVNAAHADIVAICDADDVVDTGWLGALVQGLDDHDMVGGALAFHEINTTETMALRGWTRTTEPVCSIGREFRFLDQVICGNVAFRRTVWETIGGFDEAFSRGGDDVDFSWRAQLAGFTVGARSDAVLHCRARSDRRSMFRQYVRDGEGGAHLYAVYRNRGMPRRRVREAVRTVLWSMRHVHKLKWGTPMEQGHVIRVAGKQWGRIVGSVRHRVVFP